jgi:hypothetical protein
MNMKKLPLFVLSAICLILLISNGSCKDFGSPDYQLTITVNQGIVGNPESGTYSYKEFSVVDYNYTPLNSSLTVEVIRNGENWASSGSFKMYCDTEMVVQVLDIRGRWKFTLEQSDIEFAEYNVTFSGSDPLSGTFTDDRGYSGTWVVNGTDFTMTYSDWVDYIFTGDIFYMDGTWTGEGFLGTWSGLREN